MSPIEASNSTLCHSGGKYEKRGDDVRIDRLRIERKEIEFCLRRAYDRKGERARAL